MKIQVDGEAVTFSQDGMYKSKQGTWLLIDSCRGWAGMLAMTDKPQGSIVSVMNGDKVVWSAQVDPSNTWEVLDMHGYPKRRYRLEGIKQLIKEFKAHKSWMSPEQITWLDRTENLDKWPSADGAGEGRGGAGRRSLCYPFPLTWHLIGLQHDLASSAGLWWAFNWTLEQYTKRPDNEDFEYRVSSEGFEANTQRWLSVDNLAADYLMTQNPLAHRRIELLTRKVPTMGAMLRANLLARLCGIEAPLPSDDIDRLFFNSDIEKASCWLFYYAILGKSPTSNFPHSIRQWNLQRDQDIPIAWQVCGMLAWAHVLLGKGVYNNLGARRVFDEIMAVPKERLGSKAWWQLRGNEHQIRNAPHTLLLGWGDSQEPFNIRPWYKPKATGFVSSVLEAWKK